VLKGGNERVMVWYKTSAGSDRLVLEDRADLLLLLLRSRRGVWCGGVP
jgi:hypothetical protein